MIKRFWRWLTKCRHYPWDWDVLEDEELFCCKRCGETFGGE